MPRTEREEKAIAAAEAIDAIDACQDNRQAREAVYVKRGLPSASVQDEERERDEQACRYLAEVSEAYRVCWEAIGRPAQTMKPNRPFEISELQLQALLTRELESLLAYNAPHLVDNLRDALAVVMNEREGGDGTLLNRLRRARAHAEDMAHRLDRMERSIHHCNYREAAEAPGAERFEGWRRERP